MATFVSDCPRCGVVNSNLDCYGSTPTKTEYNWKVFCELFVVCRACHRSSLLLVSAKKSDESLTRLLQQQNKIVELSHSLNDYVVLERVISILDRSISAPPEYLPKQIDGIIREGNTCLSAQCWNAAGAMYRLALDISTKGFLPSEGEPNAKIRRSLGLRLSWLFDQEILQQDLRLLAECVQQDGNDGAHDGSLSKADAEDLHDFSYELLRRLYTGPSKLKEAEERRKQRRAER